MQCYFSRLLVLFLATVLQQFTVTVGLRQSLSVRRPSITHMQHRMPVARASAQAMGFTCRNCNNIFDSRRSMECHRRHVTSQGTPCADPSSYKSLSFTGRASADTSTAILREHAGTLGAFSNCCPRCVLRALFKSLTTIFGVLLVRYCRLMAYNSYNSRIIVE
jgi:hypothetical protein